MDHVPVEADLSDLEEKIRWCRQNDDKCRAIGENAKKFYEKYVARKPLLDYVEMVCKQVAKRYVPPPDWWTPPPSEVAAPSLRKPDVLCYTDRKTDESRLCVRCKEEQDKEEEEKRSAREKEEEERKNMGDLKSRLAARRKRKAREAQQAAAKRKKPA